MPKISWRGDKISIEEIAIAFQSALVLPEAIISQRGSDKDPKELALTYETCWESQQNKHKWLLAQAQHFSDSSRAAIT